MKLESIYITGFKSFADRTNIQFHHGITGVIGPNGSGKSNIIDAVRWVMGEQTSKNLRAEDPSDMIFSGSQNRKPVNFAEVTLTFSNDGRHCPVEYLHLPKVSIGRRIYRDGEREYFLNGEPCRLRDIMDLLMWMGLGSKSYGVIPQEKRDRIIQASPDDLREILEETAGITIFKMRRKEAEKRMVATRERLLGLGQIETELARQKEALSEQVEKASLKFSYVQELKEKETDLIKNHISFYQQIAAQVKHEIDTKSGEIQSSFLESTDLEIQANDLKIEHVSLLQKIKEAENERDDQKILLTKYTERKNSYEQRLHERRTQKDQLALDLSREREAFEAETARRAKALHEMESAERLLRNLEDMIATVQMDLDEREEELRVYRSRSEELRSELRAIEQTRHMLQVQNESILQSISKSNAQLQKLAEQENEYAVATGQLLADKQAALGELSQLSQGLDQRAVKKSTLEHQLAVLSADVTAAKQQRDEQRSSLLEVSSQAAGLQKLMDANVGLSDGVLGLQTHVSSHLMGFLFDSVSLHVHDEPLLEQAFPHLFQAAVVHQVEDFMEVLDKAEELSFSQIHLFLKESVLPLTSQEEGLLKELLSWRGVRCVGQRIERIAWPFLQPFFDRMLIVSDEWIALKAQKRVEGLASFVFVTERGAVFAAGFPISFGRPSQAISSGLLQRRRDHEEALKQKLHYEEKLAASEGQVFLLTQKQTAVSQELGTMTASFEQEKIESLKLTTLLDHVDRQEKHLQAQQKKLSTEQDEYKQDMNQSREKFAKNQIALEKLDEESLQLEARVNECDSQYQDKKSYRDEQAAVLHQKKSDRAVVLERLSQQKQHYEDLMAHIHRLEQKCNALVVHLDNLTADLTHQNEDASSLDNEIQHVKSLLLSRESLLEDLVGTESQIAEELRVIEGRLKKDKESAQQKQNMLQDKRLELARLEAILETSLREAFEKFGLTAQQFAVTEVDGSAQYKQSLEHRIKELHNLITELGPVNERAVDEFTDVATRLHFLCDQKQDIEASLLELSQSIADIEETTKIRFEQVFTRVNTEFQHLFPILFPGGEAHLHLLNATDLLTSGVEILVRLPGKKMQNMSLFSGGEKALTAISLIFSLLKTTPAPFCFLDEVDAPLDEANVGRFNDILEALSQEFQFVVITHNRRTMEVLDTIYGISMAEPGVSKLVSVDLTEVPENLKKKQKTALPTNRSGASVTG